MQDHPFAGGPVPGDVLDANPEIARICCPLCKSDNFRAVSNQYGVTRICNDCRNEWSGGVMGSVPDPYNMGSSGSPPSVDAPEAHDYPDHPALGPEFNPYGDDI